MPFQSVFQLQSKLAGIIVSCHTLTKSVSVIHFSIHDLKKRAVKCLHHIKTCLIHNIQRIDILRICGFCNCNITAGSLGSFGVLCRKYCCSCHNSRSCYCSCQKRCQYFFSHLFVPPLAQRVFPFSHWVTMIYVRWYYILIFLSSLSWNSIRNFPFAHKTLSFILPTGRIGVKKYLSWFWSSARNGISEMRVHT